MTMYLIDQLLKIAILAPVLLFIPAPLFGEARSD